MLTAAKVAIYPVSALGVLGDPTFDASKLAGSRRELEARLSANQIAMETIAQETGGRAFYSTNALGDAVKDAVSNGSHYYTLAYSPANNKNDGKFRRIQVSLVDNNYTLSYRRGYFADQPSHEFISEEGADDPLVAYRFRYAGFRPDPIQAAGCAEESAASCECPACGK